MTWKNDIKKLINQIITTAEQYDDMYRQEAPNETLNKYAKLHEDKFDEAINFISNLLEQKKKEAYNEGYETGARNAANDISQNIHKLI